MNDAAQGRLAKAEIDAHVNANLDLRIVRDLANGAKHAQLTRRHRATGASLGFPVWIGDGNSNPPSTAERMWVTVEGPDFPESLEVVDVAHAALVAWEDLLLKAGLSLPPHEEPTPGT